MIVPEYEPVAEGEKVTVIVWLPPGGTERLGGFTLKMPFPVVMPETVNVAVPVLPTETVCWLLEPTVALPNDTTVVGMLMMGAETVDVERSIIPYLPARL